LSGPLFLPGVDEAHVRARLNAAGGDEIGSGKFALPESSAALAAMGTPLEVSVEFSAPFPWPAGRHPWLDAVVITAMHRCTSSASNPNATSRQTGCVISPFP
jgi:hypothetical protein